MKRRQFLKAGVIGGAALAAGGAFVAWRDTRRADEAPEAGRLAVQARIDRIIGAIAPVLLAGTLSVDPAQRVDALSRVSKDVGSVVALFTPPVRNEVHELFSLLDIGVTRWTLTGIGSWADAHPDAIVAFLERWRHSRIGMLQSAYHALHDLVFGAWYASDATWGALGYAGPPNVE